MFVGEKSMIEALSAERRTLERTADDLQFAYNKLPKVVDRPVRPRLPRENANSSEYFKYTTALARWEQDVEQHSITDSEILKLREEYYGKAIGLIDCITYPYGNLGSIREFMALEASLRAEPIREYARMLKSFNTISKQ